jgi:protease I
MAKKTLAGVRVAVLAADGFEQVELTGPVKQLRKRGAHVDIVSLRPGSIRGMNLIALGKQVKVDETVLSASPNDYDALFVPGGFANPDFLRQSEQALMFVRAFDRANKPIGVICHAPWVLVSAGLAHGRTLTSWPGISDDLRNAGANWQNAAVVRDRNWLSSRGPMDLAMFEDALIDFFAERVPEKARRPVEHGGVSRLVRTAAMAAGAFALKRAYMALRT